MVKRALNRFSYVLAALVLMAVPLLHLPKISAATLTSRTVQVPDPKVGAITTHLFTFDIASSASVGSVKFEYCANSPLFSAPCDAPSGLDVSGANIDFQSGETGFNVHAATSPNRLVLTRPASVSSPGTAQYVFSNMINQNTASTAYIRISLHAADDGTGPNIDQGSVAYSTVSTLTTTAYVPPILIFCVGVSVVGNCSSSSGNFIDLGEFSAFAESVATSQYAGATNDPDGYTVTVYGTTLTSGNNIIPALANPTASKPGSGQFGINLRNNTNPDIGANISGGGTAQAMSDYDTPNLFKFVNGDVLSQSIFATEFNTATVSYLANIPNGQPAGIYSATFTFIATATF